jgi:ribosomal protein L34E
MAFSTFCTNKGCGANMTPYLDPQDNKVYCEKCDNEITNITQFAKSQMKANKQFKQKQNKPFVFKCNNCKKEDTPIILNNDVVCGSCQKPLDNLSPIFKNMLKDKLKTTKKDV